MKRREFITLLGGAAATWPLAARAQQVGKLYRIGVLETTPANMNAANIDALRDGMRVLGYVEGRNLIIEYRSADGRGERFPGLVMDLLRLKVDVIVTRGNTSSSCRKECNNDGARGHGSDGRTAHGGF